LWIDRALRPIVQRLKQTLEDAGLPAIGQRVLIRSDGPFSDIKKMPETWSRGDIVTFGPTELAKRTYGEHSEPHYAARILEAYRALCVNAANGDFDMAIYLAYRLGVLCRDADLLRDAERGYSSVANLHRYGTAERQQRKQAWKQRVLELADDMRRRNPALSDLEIAKRLARGFASSRAPMGDDPPGERSIRRYLSEP
jgi:hypothetical protein